MDAALSRCGVGASAIQVGLFLANRATAHGDGIAVSAKRIALGTGLGQRTVVRSLRDLQDARAIGQTRQGKTGTPNAFRLLPPEEFVQLPEGRWSRHSLAKRGLADVPMNDLMADDPDADQVTGTAEDDEMITQQDRARERAAQTASGRPYPGPIVARGKTGDQWRADRQAKLDNEYAKFIASL